MIPCLKEKCLKFPACKSRGVIACQDLENYYYYLLKRYQKFKTWLTIHETLPNVHTISILHADGFFYPDLNTPYALIDARKLNRERLKTNGRNPL